MALKGVIVELDFAVANGAQVMRDTATKLLEDIDNIPFNAKVEAQYFIGRDYLSAFTRYFQSIKTKKTPLKASIDFAARFSSALDEALAVEAPPAFVRFVADLVDREVRVVLITRSESESTVMANLSVLSDMVTIAVEPSHAYGFNHRDLWQRVMTEFDFKPSSTVAVVGSGMSLKATMISGLRTVVVPNPQVAYHDFTGADEVLEDYSAQASAKVLRLLGL